MMNAPETGDRVAPFRAATRVGYVCRHGSAMPALPSGYELVPVQRVEDLRGLNPMIVLADAALASGGDGFREIAAILGQGSVILAAVAGATKPADLAALIDAGADDAVNTEDAALMALALKRAEKVLVREEALCARSHELEIERNNLQAAIDHLPSPIFFKNRDGTYCGCNKAFENYLGLPADKILGRTVFEVSPCDYARVYHAADEDLMARGGVQIYDAAVRYANGDLREVTFHKAVTHDKVAGTVNGLAGAMLDITERKRLEESLTHAAERDYLTGAYNRRKFFELADKLTGAADTAKAGLAVLAIDVDHFKNINDRFGHACGDMVLRHLVGILEEQLPGPHVFARAGGEEFFAILVGHPLEEAFEIAERVRLNVEGASFDFEGVAVPFTVSIGLAEVAAAEGTSQAILRADQALYRAKGGGRNRVAAS